MILAAFIVAIKYNEDRIYDNDFYSKVGGVTKKDLNKLEFNFLTLIGFNLFVDDETYKKYNDYFPDDQEVSDEDTENDEYELLAEDGNYHLNKINSTNTNTENIKEKRKLS